MDDRFLIQQTLAGHSGAFRFLVLRHSGRVFAFLGALLKDDALVEDLAQETFLKAFRSLDSFDPERGAAFSTWLLTIARNLAYNELAKKRVRAQGVPESQCTGEDADAEEALSRARNAAAVRAALAELPEIFRAPVVLSCFEGCSSAEIAAIEGCAEGTVKSRIHRGKTMLRRALAPRIGRKNDDHL